MTARIPQLVLTITLSLAVGPTAWATARFSGEKGTRGHRTRLAAGNLQTCAILDDGTVDCWGDNRFGQLGDGTTTPRLTPVPVSGLGGSAISIASDELHTC